MSRYKTIHLAIILILLSPFTSHAGKPTQTINADPIFEANLVDGNIDQGAEYIQQIIASDADGDVLNYAIINNPGWLTTVSVISGKGKTKTVTTYLSGTPNADDSDALNIRIAVDDGWGGYNESNSFNITINKAVLPQNCTFTTLDAVSVNLLHGENIDLFTYDNSATCTEITTASCSDGTVTANGYQNCIVTNIPTPDACLSEASATSTTCRNSISVTEGDVEYFANYSLATANSAVTRAVFVVHGVGRTPWDPYNNMINAATLEQQQRNTIIVAPYFKMAEDNPGDSELYWDSGWSVGYDSKDGSSVSSFAIMDKLVSRVLDRANFPNITEVVIIGHSAGGQFVQRYAAGTKVDYDATVTGHAFRFIVSNPGTYMYLDNKRPADEYSVTEQFVIPSTVPSESDPTDKNCVTLADGETYLDYDEYKYGIMNRSRASYMNAKDEVTLLEDYKTRKVIYLVGTADNDRNSSNLAQSCEADLQGYHRYQRALNFYNHINQVIPDHAHDFVKVLNVWHTSSQMYPSVSGRTALFVGISDSDGDGFIDNDDNCPNLYNDQVDSDNDGIGDACDNPTDEDLDGDSLHNMYDNCPFNYNPDQLDSNADGLGDACSRCSVDGICGTSGELEIRQVITVDTNHIDADGDSDKVYKNEFKAMYYIKNWTANTINGGNWSFSVPIWGQLPTDPADIGHGIPTQDGAKMTVTGTDNLNGNGTEEEYFWIYIQGKDSDEDTIYWPRDNCPNTINPDQLDSDGDGIGDACES